MCESAHENYQQWGKCRLTYFWFSLSYKNCQRNFLAPQFVKLERLWAVLTFMKIQIKLFQGERWVFLSKWSLVILTTVDLLSRIVFYLESKYSWNLSMSRLKTTMNWLSILKCYKKEVCVFVLLTHKIKMSTKEKVFTAVI